MLPLLLPLLLGAPLGAVEVTRPRGVSLTSKDPPPLPLPSPC